MSSPSAAQREVRVTKHAYDQARSRSAYPDAEQAWLLNRIICDEVRLAFAEGRFAHRCRWEGLNGGKPKARMSGNRRFVWEEGERVGWVVCREKERDVVLTTFVRIVR